MYRRIALLLLLFCAALCQGCSKSLSYDTRYVIKPWVKTQNQTNLISLVEARAYAFGADTTDWYVASYQDALEGIITRRNSSEQNSQPVAVGELYSPVIDTIPSSANWLQMSIGTSSMMVVVVDPSDNLYAYTQQSFYENLSPFYTSVVFQPGNDRNRYTSGPWVYIDEFYDPDAPKWTDYVLKPKVQLEEGGAETAQLNVDLYAFAADTTEWCVASYPEAVARIITSKKDPQEKLTEPNFVGAIDQAGEKEGWLRLSSNVEKLMLVAVCPDLQMYAYRSLTLVLDKKEVSETLVFRVWRPELLYVEGKDWRVVPAVATGPENSETDKR